MNSWMKYLGIAGAFAGVGMKVFSWLRTAQAANSPGGEDITPEEIPLLQDVISEAINTGLQAADVPIMAEVTLMYIGEMQGETQD